MLIKGLPFWALCRTFLPSVGNPSPSGPSRTHNGGCIQPYMLWRFLRTHRCSGNPCIFWRCPYTRFVQSLMQLHLDRMGCLMVWLRKGTDRLKNGLDLFSPPAGMLGRYLIMFFQFESCALTLVQFFLIFELFNSFFFSVFTESTAFSHSSTLHL